MRARPLPVGTPAPAPSPQGAFADLSHQLEQVSASLSAEKLRRQQDGGGDGDGGTLAATAVADVRRSKRTFGQVWPAPRSVDTLGRGPFRIATPSISRPTCSAWRRPSLRLEAQEVVPHSWRPTLWGGCGCPAPTRCGLGAASPHPAASPRAGRRRPCQSRQMRAPLRPRLPRAPAADPDTSRCCYLPSR